MSTPNDQEHAEKETVKVFFRARPMTPQEITAGPECIEIVDNEHIYYRHPKDIKRQLKYKFDHVFGPNADQIQVFQKAAHPLVADVIKGQDALLFTYGITNSGKTYTMQGSEEDLDGIMPRTLDVLFNTIHEQRAKWYTFVIDGHKGSVSVRDAAEAKQLRQTHREEHPEDRVLMDVDSSAGIETRRRSYEPSTLPLSDPDTRYSIFISYVEIYRNYVYDLFDDRPLFKEDAFNSKSRGKQLKTSLDVKLARNGQYYVQGATWKEVHSTDEAFRLLEEGKNIRKVGATNLNNQSSRSHSIFTIKVVSAPLNASGSDIVRDEDVPPHVAQISLVDLAGSERSNRSGSKGNQQKEGIDINKSLTKLRDCFKALRDAQQNKKKKKKLIQYREYSLTYLFQKYLMGNGKISMIVCASPAWPDAAETSYVLEFAQLTGQIETTVSENAPIYKGYESGRGLQRRLERRAHQRVGAGNLSLSDVEDDEHAKRGANDIAEDDLPRGVYATLQDELNAIEDGGPALQYQAGALLSKRSKHSNSLQLDDAIDNINKDVHFALAQQRQQLEEAQKQFRGYLCSKETEFLEQSRRISDLMLQLSEEKSRCDCLEKKTENVMKESASACAHLEAQITEQRADLDRLESELTSSRRKNEALLAEKVELESQLHNMRRELSKYEGELREKDYRTHVLAREVQEKDNEHRGHMERMSKEMHRRDQKMLALEERMGRVRTIIEQRKLNTPTKTLISNNAYPPPAPPGQPRMFSHSQLNMDVEADKHEIQHKTPQKKPLEKQLQQEHRKPGSEEVDGHNSMDYVQDAYAEQENHPPNSNMLMMVDPAHSEPKATKVYNHVPENSHAIDGAILQNSSNKKAAFNRRLDVKGLKGRDLYVLNHADSPNKQDLFKGVIAKSISKDGYSVRLTGHEILQVNKLDEECHESEQGDIHYKSANQFANQATLSPMKRM